MLSQWEQGGGRLKGQDTRKGKDEGGSHSLFRIPLLYDWFFFFSRVFSTCWLEEPTDRTWGFGLSDGVWVYARKMDQLGQDW